MRDDELRRLLARAVEQLRQKDPVEVMDNCACRASAPNLDITPVDIARLYDHAGEGAAAEACRKTPETIKPAHKDTVLLLVRAALKQANLPFEN